MGDAIAGGGGPGEALVEGANYTAALSPKLGEHSESLSCGSKSSRASLTALSLCNGVLR